MPRTNVVQSDMSAAKAYVQQPVFERLTSTKKLTAKGAVGAGDRTASVSPRGDGGDEQYFDEPGECCTMHSWQEDTYEVDEIVVTVAQMVLAPCSICQRI